MSPSPVVYAALGGQPEPPSWPDGYYTRRSCLGPGNCTLSVSYRPQMIRLSRSELHAVEHVLLNFLLSNCTWEDGEVIATLR